MSSVTSFSPEDAARVLDEVPDYEHVVGRRILGIVDILTGFFVALAYLSIAYFAAAGLLDDPRTGTMLLWLIALGILLSVLAQGLVLRRRGFTGYAHRWAGGKKMGRLPTDSFLVLLSLYVPFPSMLTFGLNRGQFPSFDQAMYSVVLAGGFVLVFALITANDLDDRILRIATGTFLLLGGLVAVTIPSNADFSAAFAAAGAFIGTVMVTRGVVRLARG